MSAVLIDLNADVGERTGAQGIAADAELLAGVSSVNVACGFHAGDGETMRAICELAVARRKRIGAHVSYLDREGFGRRDLDVAPSTLADHVAQQIRALQIQATAAGGRVTYVKPHGALYNRAAVDQTVADAITAGVWSVDPELSLLTLPGSQLEAAAASLGLPAVGEGFADRAYAANGTLLPRSEPGSVLTVEEAVAQAKLIAVQRQAVAIDGTVLPLEVRSLCVHSDTPGAAQLAVRVRDALIGAGCEVRPFT